MNTRIQHLQTARKIDELEEIKNRLVKCQDRVREADKLHRQYRELKAHWDARDKYLKGGDIKYSRLEGDYQDLVQINFELKEEVEELKLRLGAGMSRLRSTAGKLGSLEKRYLLLKASCGKCLKGGPEKRGPRGTPRPRRRTPRRLALERRKVFK